MNDPVLVRARHAALVVVASLLLGAPIARAQQAPPSAAAVSTGPSRLQARPLDSSLALRRLREERGSMGPEWAFSTMGVVLGAVGFGVCGLALLGDGASLTITHIIGADDGPDIRRMIVEGIVGGAAIVMLVASAIWSAVLKEHESSLDDLIRELESTVLLGIAPTAGGAVATFALPL